MSSTESTHERAAKGIAAIEKLKGPENYLPWSDKVLLILASHGFDSDEQSRSLNIESKEADRRIRATLLLAMEDPVCKAVRSCLTTAELWKMTKAKYGTPSKMAQGQLLSRFYGVHLQPSQSVQAFIDEKRSLQQQLDNAGCDVPDSKLALMILVGARNRFESVCESLVDNPDLTVATVEERLIHAEEARVLEGKAVVDTAMHAVGKTRAKKQCGKCGKFGYHSEKNCWSGTRCGNCGGEHPDRVCRRTNPRNLKPDQIAKLAQLLDSVSDKSSELQGYTYFAALNVSCESDARFIVDSGATTHMTGLDHMLEDKSQCSGIVRVANNTKEHIKLQGWRTLKFDTGASESLQMLCVPALGANSLLSVRKLVENGRKMTFTTTGCELHGADGELIASGQCNRDGLYKFLPCQQESSQLAAMSTADQTTGKDLELWHNRLGHRNYCDIELLAKSNKCGMAMKWRFDSKLKHRCCPTCEIAKAHRQPYPARSTTQPKEVLSLVVNDVCGPMQVPSIGGAQYFVVFVDAASEKIFTYLILRKSEVCATFLRFQAWAERKTGKRLRTLRTDNGGEYLSREFKDLFESSGIEHQTTVPYCSPQNGLAERRLYTLMNSVRSMLRHSGLGKEYWGAAVLYATDIANSCPSAKDRLTTPAARFKGRTGSTDLSRFRVFGCDCYALRPHTRKLAPLVFIGFPCSQKGWKLYDPRTRKISIHRHVTFNERSFTHHKMLAEPSSRHVHNLELSGFSESCDGSQPEATPESPSSTSLPDPQARDDGPLRSSRRRIPPQRFGIVPPNTQSDGGESGGGNDAGEPFRVESQSETGGETSDIDAQDSAFCACISDGGDGGVQEAAQMYLDNSLSAVREALDECDREEAANREAAFNAYESLCMATADKRDIYTPSSYEDAMRCTDREKWKKAIEVELGAITRNEVMKEVPSVPAGHTAIGTKWVFKIKFKKDGSIDIY